VTATYDLFDEPLVKEIEQRSHRNEPYSESSLWFLLRGLVTAGCFLHDNSKVFGDLRSENIFAQIEEHNLKIATPVSWPAESSLLSKYHSGENLFLSPEAIEQLENNGPLSHKIGCNNDAFAIGMTLAECLLL
jgi:serine/threonine protein kinase